MTQRIHWWNPFLRSIPGNMSNTRLENDLSRKVMKTFPLTAYRQRHGRMAQYYIFYMQWNPWWRTTLLRDHPCFEATFLSWTSSSGQSENSSVQYVNSSVQSEIVWKLFCSICQLFCSICKFFCSICQLFCAICNSSVQSENCSVQSVKSTLLFNL